MGTKNVCIKSVSVTVADWRILVLTSRNRSTLLSLGSIDHVRTSITTSIGLSVVSKEQPPGEKEEGM
jgi:hypothetical protein